MGTWVGTMLESFIDWQYNNSYHKIDEDVLLHIRVVSIGLRHPWVVRLTLGYTYGMMDTEIR